MAEYMARRIREGHLIYKDLFAIERNKKWQEETDKLLIEQGGEDLIVD